jgi:tripartite-type tricarboxylate transporter receptor subunit TctC
VADLVAAARARPGELTYGSSSVGSAGHLAAAVLDQAAGVQTVHIPYRGGGQLITDLITGKVDFAFATAATTAQHVQTGRLRALAVPTARRSTLFPELPTIAEGGVAGFDVVNWYGLAAPRATPAPIIATLNAAVQDALREPEIVAKLAAQGIEPLPGSAADFAAFLQAETLRWARVVRLAGITTE